MDCTIRSGNQELMFVTSSQEKEPAPSKPLMDYSCIPGNECLLNLKIRRKELEAIINYLVVKHPTFSEQSIFQKKNTGLAFSFALNSEDNSPIIILKKRHKEIARNYFSISYAYDMKSQSLKVFKSGPEADFFENESKINKTLYNSPERHMFAVTNDFYKYFAPIKTPNSQGENHPEGTKKIGFFLELHSNGDLKDYLIKNPLSPSKALSIAIKIVEILNVLHNKFKVMHNDLKFENILVSKDGSLKLADFGHAASFREDVQYFGTTFYASPESRAVRLGYYYDANITYQKVLSVISPISTHVFCRSMKMTRAAHPSADIWSVGVILIRLFGNETLFTDWCCMVVNDDKFLLSFESLKSKLIADLSKELHSKISEDVMVKKIIDVISQCLTFNSQQRITTQELLTSLSKIKLTSDKPYSNDNLFNFEQKFGLYNSAPAKKRKNK